jgi:hypothetical protein
MKIPVLSTLLATLALSSWPYSAHAVLIKFNESLRLVNGQEVVVTNPPAIVPSVTIAPGVNVPNCGGGAPQPCVLGAVSGEESASVDLLVPALPNGNPLFDVPAGGVATAYVLEPDMKTISDKLELRVFPASSQQLSVSFLSDSNDAGGFGRVPNGFVFSSGLTVEDNLFDATLTFAFFTGPPDNPALQRPYSLPSGYSITAHSDVDPGPAGVPEPGTLLLLGTSLAGLSIAAWKRRLPRSR